MKKRIVSWTLRRISIFLIAAIICGMIVPLFSMRTFAAESWLWPVNDCYIISSNYGLRDLDGDGTMDNYHRGIDIVGASSTYGMPVRAAKGGTVYASCNTIADGTFISGSCGNYVAINHGDGTYSIYMHMRPNGIVTSGSVKQGDIIGYIGNTGESYGAHLHFQMYTNPDNRNGSTLNPMPTNSNITIWNQYVLPSGWPSTKTTYVFSSTPGGAPTYATVSTDKKSYAVDETVTFTMRSNGNTNTLWIYCPDGSKLYYQNAGTTFTLAFGMSGHFQALVETWNGVGSYCSERIDFVVGPPTYAVLSTDYFSYAVDETVTFTMDSDGNTNTLWIYCPDGSKLYYTEAGTTFTLAFGMSGHFQALVETWNGVGSYCSERIDFVVGPPTYAVVETDHTSYAVDETVTFTMDSDGNTNTLWIYCPDGSKLYYTEAGKTFTLAFGMSGHFRALVETWNGNGSCCSEKIDFVVGPPTYATIKSNKSTYKVNEEVVFTCDSDGSNNIIWVYYPDGTNSCYKNVGETYKLKFTSPGSYQALVQSYNRVGSCISDRINFNVECNHSYEDQIVRPTCTSPGYTTHTCSRCDDSYVDTYVDALGHTEVIDDAVPATCTTDGKTEGKHCSVCDAVLVAQQTVPALGHAWDAGKVTTAPTATTDGVRTYTCTRCGVTRTEAIPATGGGEPEQTPACDGGAACPSAHFTDEPKPGNWAHAGVDYAVSNGLFNGMSDTTFEPGTAMTRAMLVTVLWRYAGQPVEGNNPFSDVENGKWYTKPIAWASANGIVNGVSADRFDPLGVVTREQLATILYRYCGANGIDNSAQTDLSGFPDVGNVSSYAKEAVSWAVAEGIIGGNKIDGVTCIDPKGNATRAQVATIMMRFIENVVKR